jgi:raffinose/stachyose/melibiose transport system substrate-binding protein
MRSTRNTRKYAAVAIAAAVALGLTACGSSGSSNGSSPAKVTLTWWSNANAGPLYSVFQTIMKNYHAAHPNVSFSFVPIQNEDWDTKIQVALQGHKVPDIFFQRGSGYMAAQVKSGELANLAPYVSSWIGEIGTQKQLWENSSGQLYGIPYDLHAVGFWYRKDLFTRAGITSTPTTLPELNADVTKLKAAGIAPIAVGSKDQWPDAFFYDYFVVRECSKSTIAAAVKADSASATCFTKAGNDLQSFMATNPFQPSFLNTPSQVGAGSSAGLVASGQAAMELQGDWDPSVMQALVPASTWTADTANLGWFPFPSVPGAAGNGQAVLGGADGNSCSTKAPEPACADFLEYVDSPPAQKLIVGSSLLPANAAASSAVTLGADLQELQYTKTAPYVQEYLDLAYPTNVGNALDAAVANFFAKPTASPSSIITAINGAGAQS